MNMRIQRMSETKTWKVHSASFKAKVALETIRETKTLNEIGQEYGVPPVQMSHWKNALLEKASEVFEGKRSPQVVTAHSDPERLYSEIGRLKMDTPSIVTPLELLEDEKDERQD
jgi:transposase-like protein